MEVRNTKDLTLEAAIDLFSEKGYSNVSMRDLAKQVGIQPATLYHHFKNKEEIMSEILVRYHSRSLRTFTYEETMSQMRRFDGLTFEEIMQKVFAPYSPHEAERMRKMSRIMIQEQFTHSLAEVFWRDVAIKRVTRSWRWFLDSLVKDGRIPPINTLLAAELLTRIPITYILQYAHYQDDEDGEDSLSMQTLLGYITDRIQRGEM